MKYLVGIDNGGTFSKAAVFDEDGRQISAASVPTEGSAGHTAGEPGTVRWYGCKYDWCKEEYHHCEYGIYRCCYV